MCINYQPSFLKLNAEKAREQEQNEKKTETKHIKRLVL